MNTQKLKALIVEHYKTQGEVAQEIGLDRSTFYRKMINHSFNVEEINAIVKAIPLTPEEAMEIFLYSSCHKNETLN